MDFFASGRCLEEPGASFGGVDRQWNELWLAHTTVRVEGPAAENLFSLSLSLLCEELGGVNRLMTEQGREQGVTNYHLSLIKRAKRVIYAFFASVVAYVSDHDMIVIFIRLLCSFGS